MNGITNAIAISAESQHSLALLADGRIVAWGDNADGQLGNGVWWYSLVPLPILFVPGAPTAVSASDGASADKITVAWAGGTNASVTNGMGYASVSADYDGDRKADPAIYVESNGVWALKISSADYLTIILAQPLGGAGYLPAPADYDGDGFADPAVRSDLSLSAAANAETTNVWIVMFSTADYAPVWLTLDFD